MTSFLVIKLTDDAIHLLDALFERIFLEFRILLLSCGFFSKRDINDLYFLKLTKRQKIENLPICDLANFIYFYLLCALIGDAGLHLFEIFVLAYFTPFWDFWRCKKTPFLDFLQVFFKKSLLKMINLYFIVNYNGFSLILYINVNYCW